MANVNISIDQLFTQAGSDNKSRRLSFLSTATKAAQNDTITLVGAKSVELVQLQIVATGAQEPYTVSGNVVTLTSATTGAVKGTLIYR